MAEKKVVFMEGAVASEGTSSNRTGCWRTFRPEVDAVKCIGCRQCVISCPDSCIDMRDMKGLSGKKADVNYNYCKGCLICITVCPVKAITSKREDAEAENGVKGFA